jgi:cyclophilin family peptidyl-prolyl cis-trans isomerase
MSNKTLITVIIILLAVAGGGVLAYNAYQNHQTVSGIGQQADQITQPSNQQPDNNQVATSTPVATTTAQSTNTQGQHMTDCKRDFNADKVNISGRQVAINVKGFGTINLEFYDKDAPKAVENFLRLANSGYYDCLTFHRVAKGFVIQGGDPKGDGSGGSSAFGAPFADELNANTPSYKAGYVKGVLAMANSGPNTNGSQFFIMLADNNLPHLYTIFGKVTSGLDVVDKIAAVDITPQMGPTDGTPVTPVVMESVKITK